MFCTNFWSSTTTVFLTYTLDPEIISRKWQDTSDESRQKVQNAGNHSSPLSRMKRINKSFHLTRNRLLIGIVSFDSSNLSGMYVERGCISFPFSGLNNLYTISTQQDVTVTIVAALQF